MKNIISTLFLLLASVSAKAGSAVNVSGTFQNISTRHGIVAFYSEHEAASSLPGCKTTGAPDGDPQTYPKVKQRLTVLSGSSFSASVPKVFGFCKYTLANAGIVVMNPEVINSLIRQGAEQVDQGVYEFKGGLSGIVPLKSGKQPSNDLNCAWSDIAFAECNAEAVISNGSSLVLSVHLQ